MTRGIFGVVGLLSLIRGNQFGQSIKMRGGVRVRISLHFIASGWLLSAGLLSAQKPPQTLTEGTPKVDVLDFFGLGKIPEGAHPKGFGIQREGDPFPPSKGDLEEKLDAQPDVVESHLEAVCCDAGSAILYVGIEEKGAIHFDVREAPEGDAELPKVILSDYRDFLDAYASAARRGALAEDLTHGHSLMADPLTREIQLKFLDLAKANQGILRNVLRNSADDEQRAERGLRDDLCSRQTHDCRRSAVRPARRRSGCASERRAGIDCARSVVRGLIRDQMIRIEPTWFVEMLNSVSWSDLRSRYR